MGKGYGRKITIFLIDGFPTGRMTCELSNWIGTAIKFPRNMLAECADRAELGGIGVYFLFGKNPTDSEKNMVYIGETEALYPRLKEHQKKDFWNEAIAFCGNLDKAKIKYLERKLYDIALEADRYKLENSNIPTGAKISEADQAAMNEFVENIILIVHTLGHNVFEKLSAQQIPQEVFQIKAARGADATGARTSEGFVVFKGSTIADSTVKTCPQAYRKYRTDLIENGVVNKEEDILIFSKDFLFSSPSAAAGIVMGRSANGLIEWKLPDGRTLKECEAG